MAYNIPLIKPYITDKIKQMVLQVLESGQLTEGTVTQELESVFANYIGVKCAIAVTSCTTGLELALRALEIGRGDEVIVPDYTYPATATAVAMVGATPVIVDVDASTQLLDYAAVKRAITAKTRALIPVSIFGNPLDYSWINEIKHKYNLAIIEDAACSIGAEWHGEKVGSLADISVFSLHPRKFITSGEGGIITTNNEGLAQWMWSFKHFGMDNTASLREGVQFVRTGTNLKLSNVQSAIALGQMQEVDTLLAERRRLAQNYLNLLQDIKGVMVPEIVSGAKHSWQTFCIILQNRDNILQNMRAKGIEVQIGTYSLHKHKAFQVAPYRLEGPMKASIKCFVNTLALPLYHGMQAKEQELVINALKAEVEQ